MREFDTDEEIREIKKEIVESRGLLIKTNNLANSLASDIKSIAKRQAGYERRFHWNSAAAYFIFATLSFVGLKLASDARIDEIEVEKIQLTRQLREIRRDLKEEVRKAEARTRAEAEAIRFYELIRQQKQREAVERYPRLVKEPLSAAEAAFFRETIDRFRRQLSLDELQIGLERLRANRFAEAADSLRTALLYDATAPHAGEVKLNLARALRRLGRSGEAVPWLQQAIDQNSDRELQDDAMWLLSECAREIGSSDLAKETLKALLRKWPRSPFVTDARRALRELSLPSRQPTTPPAAAQH